MRFVVKHLLTALLLSVTLLANPLQAATPMDTPLPDDTITRIECDYNGNTYHYDLYIPMGYGSGSVSSYPVLFIFSPGGNAVMGNMEDWLRDKRWLVAMMVESRNGPWEPIIENFLAAHDDLVLRTRVQSDMKFLTGVSGGARASSRMAYDQLREGLRGIFLQAAGSSEVYYEGRYRGNLFTYASFGDTDVNLPELGYMDDILPEEIFQWEIFSGGHQPAPQAVAERALDWLSSKVRPNEYGISGTVSGAPNCLRRLQMSTNGGYEGAVSKDHRWYVINGLPAGNHVVRESTGACTSTPGSYLVTVPPDAEERNFSFASRGNLPFLSLLLSKKIIFQDDLSEDPAICYLDCAFTGYTRWSSTLFGKWEWGEPSCGTLTGGHTGLNAISYNLDGNYDGDMFPISLMSPALDCSDYETVTLEFWRWLEVEQSLFDRAKIEITNGGGTWHTIWENPNTTIRDSEWTRVVIDISEWAGKESRVFIRWVMGPTDSHVEYCGWNIDDILVTGE